jgi:hypothetical protein
MCKELENELKTGNETADKLVAHVKRMGASKVVIPVVEDGLIKWEVTVVRLTVPSKLNVTVNVDTKPLRTSIKDIFKNESNRPL